MTSPGQLLIFGYPLGEWNDGVSMAWDGFGFRVYAVSVWYQVKVVMERRHGDLLFKSLTRGFVVRIYRTNTPMGIAISVARRVPHDEAPCGVEVVASVRAVKHWVVAGDAESAGCAGATQAW